MPGSVVFKHIQKAPLRVNTRVFVLIRRHFLQDIFTEELIADIEGSNLLALLATRAPHFFLVPYPHAKGSWKRIAGSARYS